MNEDFLIISMIKGLTEDKNYAISVTNVFEESYFDDPHVSEIFKYIKNHVSEYNSIPERDIIINNMSNDIIEDVKVIFQEVDSTDFSISKNYDWLLEETNKYLKNRSIKQAILQGIDIIDTKDNYNEIKIIIENALCKDLKVDIGSNYFQDMAQRLKRVFNATENKIKTYYPTFDELFNGGFQPYTLNMFLAKVHGHKSNIMSNIIKRQVSNGVNVALASLEMSSDMYSQRFDANFANIDINRMYINKKVKNEFLKRITEVKKQPNLGELYIKEYPTGKATVADYRIWLRELTMRGYKIDIFYCDYISLMKAETKNTGDLYKDGKNIAEELRALGFEFNIPIVTVAQINRTGTFLDFESLDMNSIGESFGIPATADSMIIQSLDEDDMIYKNELKWKCVKNRLGGRVGDTGKLYIDSKSLRIYDETELDQWLEDVKETNDTREIYEREI